METAKTNLWIRLILLTFIVGCSIARSYGQIPYFAPTVGNNKLYGYTSLKFRPGKNAQETYTTFQYGLGNHFATGLDLATSPGNTYAGVLVRYGLPVSKWFNIGFQATPSFDLNNNMRFSYLTAAMYMNGAITRNGKLFWVGNTWYGINRDSKDSINQYLYLGYSFRFGNGMSLTPMAGALYSWKFDQDTDFSFGAYLGIKAFNIYVWTNDILKSHPRVIIGIDFTL